MSNIEVKRLFDESRFPGGWKLLSLVLYAPLGLVLIIIRLCIALQAVVVAAVLPELPIIKSYVFRSISVVLGIIVKEESEVERDESAPILVANNVTLCDHIIVHTVTQCITPNTWDLPAPLNWALGVVEMGMKVSQQMVTVNVRNHLSRNQKLPILFMPEGIPTNGRVGLLKFSTLPFTFGTAVQPVVLRVTRPSVSDVAPAVLGGNMWVDLLWFLFVPYTEYNVRFLPAMRPATDETPEQFASRVQTCISEELGLPLTSHTAADAAELIKRRSDDAQRNSRGAAELQRMARQVAEVLPHVPREAVLRDLSRTRNVDATISNVLEGLISTPPPPPPPPPSATPTGQAGPSGQVLLDTAASQFPRSAHERMSSFHERKARLLESARKRYIEKHNLQLAGYNC